MNATLVPSLFACVVLLLLRRWTGWDAAEAWSTILPTAAVLGVVGAITQGYALAAVERARRRVPLPPWDGRTTSYRQSLQRHIPFWAPLGMCILVSAGAAIFALTAGRSLPEDDVSGLWGLSAFWGVMAAIIAPFRDRWPKPDPAILSRDELRVPDAKGGVLRIARSDVARIERVKAKGRLTGPWFAYRLVGHDGKELVIINWPEFVDGLGLVRRLEEWVPATGPLPHRERAADRARLQGGVAR